MREDLDKLGERAVVGLLHLRGEDAGGELIELQMVGDALAALTFSGARLISAGAFGFIDFNLTFHRA
ncbi:unnamed protein product [marine sediment metagenome]|uniref:Uncharacterized protein n=1 Tax=marine sediment metagenome TaxID=412755 RepID=X1HS69_9ZZZZ